MFKICKSISISNKTINEFFGNKKSPAFAELEKKFLSYLIKS